MRAKVRSIAATCLMVAGMPAVATEYRYSTTPGLLPLAINDDYVMAVQFWGETAGVLERGKLVQIGDWLTPSGINNHGDVALWQSAGSYVYTGGVLVPINIPDAILVTATDINDHGVVVGHYAEFPPYVGHSFIWNDGALQLIDPPEGRDIRFQGTNNLGQIVGAYLGDDGLVGFLYEDGVFTPLPHARPLDINDRGQIAGVENNKGFVDTNGEVSVIAFPGAQVTTVRSINNLGQVVGSYRLGVWYNPEYGFVASPVLPASIHVSQRVLPPLGSADLSVQVELPPPYSDVAIVNAVIEGINGEPVSPTAAREVNSGTRTLEFRTRDLAEKVRPGRNELVVSGELGNHLYFKGTGAVLLSVPFARPRYPGRSWPVPR